MAGGIARSQSKSVAVETSHNLSHSDYVDLLGDALNDRALDEETMSPSCGHGISY